jgi:hypothetical protein
MPMMATTIINSMSVKPPRRVWSFFTVDLLVSRASSVGGNQTSLLFQPAVHRRGDAHSITSFERR